MTPKDKAESVFLQVFGNAPARFFSAPGRVNLIGEHTDYNDGFVLPLAVNFQTVVAVRKRTDQTCRIIAADYVVENGLGADKRGAWEEDNFEIDQPIEVLAQRRWPNYVRGVISGLLKREFKISGVDMVISGNIPQGAGLSSSAALEVVIGEAFKSLFELSISQTDIALIGQEAEHLFAGTRCGIMDQLVSAQGKQGHALLIDCRTMQSNAVPIPKDLAILVVDSNVTRDLVDSEYNDRRLQCEEASKRLNIKALRDISLSELEVRLEGMPTDVAKRARHVVSENFRTLAMSEALATSDVKRISRLMAASHQSMRDDFEITIPAIDFLVDTINSVVGERGGVRMTGGGFGGCVIALLAPHLILQVKDVLVERYEKQTGLKETLFLCEASGGSGEIDIAL
jgi:galactokinase